MSLEVLKAASSRTFLYPSKARSIRTDDLTTRNSFLSGGTLKASCSVRYRNCVASRVLRSRRWVQGFQSLLHQVPPSQYPNWSVFVFFFSTEPCRSASLSAVWCQRSVHSRLVEVRRGLQEPIWSRTDGPRWPSASSRLSVPPCTCRHIAWK